MLSILLILISHLILNCSCTIRLLVAGGMLAYYTILLLVHLFLILPPQSPVTRHQSPVCILYHQSPAPFLSISSISLQFAFVPCHLLRTFSSATVLAGCNSWVFLCPSSLPPLHVALLPFFLTLLSSTTRACSCNFLQQHSGCRY